MSETPSPKLVSVNIDGQNVSVPEGMPLIDAAAKLGIDIPRFCYHPNLPVAGNCRMCAVEVDKARGLPISCATPCTEGMVARTATDTVKKHRAAVMEFLLVNHPIDCPICDQAGECTLQQYYMQHDLQTSRLEVEKVHYDKRVDIGPRVVLDQERCVECTRCIRFCDHVTGSSELLMVNRGDHNAISTFPGTSLDNDYSVNTADICPVGALTEKDFRFKARVWFLKEQATICPGCSKGCNVEVSYGDHAILADYNGKAFRVKPRVNDAVNKAWMCDFGRSEYRRVNDARLSAPSATALAELTASASARLAAAGPRAVLITGFEATLEEMALVRALAARLGCKALAVADRADGKADDLLLEADKHPNRRGAEWLGLAADTAQVARALRGAEVVLVHRADIVGSCPELAEAFAAVPQRIVLASQESATSRAATAVLAGASFLEKDGHWVNSAGRVQRIAKPQSWRIPAGREDDLQILAGLGAADGRVRPHEVFARLAHEVAALRGLSFASSGQGGVMGGGACA
jgi:NADH-quinone oxidoreductase subunit G